MNESFRGKAAFLTQAAFDEAVKKLGVDAPALWALLTVESRGFGFLPDRRPKILFERHIFHKRTNGRFDRTHPDISASTSGGYKGGAAEYIRLAQALKLDRQAALESTSWGLPQIMGFNASKLRYRGAEEMVAKFQEDENAQLDGAARFVSDNRALEYAFKNKKWKQVAFFYNGGQYAKNAYDIKLERYYDLYSVGNLPSIEVRSAQARLSYLGFNPQGIDGIMGNGTCSAVLAFQRARHLNATAELDDNTMRELQAAAGV